MKYPFLALFLFFSFELCAQDFHCKHSIEDYFANNRFEICNGKKNRIMGISPDGSKKEKESCTSGVNEFIEFVAKVEAESNSCKSEIDCTALTINNLWYFANKEKVAFAFNKIDAEWTKKRPIWNKCGRMNFPDLQTWISNQDSSAPHSFRCVQNRCVPKYDGKKNYFLKISESILRKSSQMTDSIKNEPSK